MFAHTDIAAAPARPCPAGRGPQGGVAILCPQPLTMSNQVVMTPGCAVKARIRCAASGGVNNDITYVSFYLPPDERADTLALMLDGPIPEAPVALGADTNFYLLHPRDAEETRLAADLFRLCDKWGVGPLEPPGSTRAGRSSDSA